MGGVPKGLLPGPDGEPLVTRLERVFKQAVPDGELVLLGRNPEYADLGLLRLADDPAEIGPVGGLHALLQYALRQGHERALLLSCDLPYLSATTLSAFVAQCAPPASAAHYDGRWQPTLSAYWPPDCIELTRRLCAAGSPGLYRALDQLAAHRVHLEYPHELCDWDTPNDMLRPHPPR